jgi:class 3 adenylate cyclase
MKNIGEYGPQTSPYELLVHLYDKIQSGELTTFQSILDYTEGLPKNANTAVIYRKVFEFQRRLYWGFFKDLNPETFPDVWKEVVVPFRAFPFAGDLKRFMSLPDIYMGLCDIHGYTRYCQENKFNLSMLDLLDRMIQADIHKLSGSVGVVSRRAAGDEILLLGASAERVMQAILLITDYFSKRRRVKDAGERNVEGGGDVVLPELKISAGVSGGQKFISLVITQDGDLSGDLINSAARLQAHANKISPDQNRVLMTSHVFQRLKANGKLPTDDPLSKIEYFNAGTVEFKGTTLQVYDTVFLPKERYRLAYQETMEGLYDSLAKDSWKTKIFDDALALVTRIVSSLPDLSFREKSEDGRTEAEKSSIMGRVKAASDFFIKEEYEKALRCLESTVKELAQVRSMDELVLQYLQGILDNYELILARYLEDLDKEVLEHLDSIYAPKDKENFLTLTKHHEMFSRVRDTARQKARNRKAVWYKASDAMTAELGIRIRSMK